MEPSNVDSALFESSNRWLVRRLRPTIRGMSFTDFEKTVQDIPEFWINDMDGAYREGFYEGFTHCIEQFEEIYSRKGFARVREIANILRDWADSLLILWRYRGEGKYKNFDSHHPIYRQLETWGTIRERILRRDKACVRCGDVVRLEVDHIIDVQNGGLPVDSNLRVLCGVCHKGKHIWST